MKDKKILTLLLLPLLLGCGGGESTSSSISSEMSLEEGKDYFTALEQAQKKTNEADSYRTYTPHANTKLDIRSEEHTSELQSLY